VRPAPKLPVPSIARTVGRGVAFRESEAALITQCIGGAVQVSITPPVTASTIAVSVTVGVDPMTYSTRPDNMVGNGLPSSSRNSGVVGIGLDEVTVRQDCDENDRQVGQAFY